jgi:hypothetical protein
MPGRSSTSSECRCACGSLAARIVAAGVQLKCRRCKRLILVPWSSAGPDWIAPDRIGSAAPPRAGRSSAERDVST